MDKDELKKIFQIASLSGDLVDVLNEATDDDSVQIKASALALVTVCAVRGMNDKEMCELVRDTFMEVTRGEAIVETKQ